MCVCGTGFLLGIWDHHVGNYKGPYSRSAAIASKLRFVATVLRRSLSN